MLGKPDSGTSVDRVMLGAASNSIPPARTCESISGSPPSWLLEKTVTLSRPDDWAPTERAASVSRIVRGWVSGVLTPSLNSNSAAALADLLTTVVAQAADAAPSKPLRVIVIFSCLPSALSRLEPVSFEPRRSARWRSRGGIAGLPCRPTKPFWGIHETTLKQTGGISTANKAAAKLPGGSDEPFNSFSGPRYPPENSGCGARGWRCGGRLGYLRPQQCGLQPDRPCHEGRQADRSDQLGRDAGPLGQLYQAKPASPGIEGGRPRGGFFVF